MDDTTTQKPNKKAKSSSTRATTSRQTSRTVTRKEPDYLQFEKFRAAEAYFSSLQATNQKSLQYFQDTINHTYTAFFASVILYVLTYLVALGALICGLVLIFNPLPNREWWTGVCLLGGVILIAILIFRDPIRNSRHFVNNLARLTVVFTGYVRQIHQVDATFRGMFLSTETSIENMEEMLLRVQGAVDNALDGINQILEDLNE